MPFGVFGLRLPGHLQSSLDQGSGLVEPAQPDQHPSGGRTEQQRVDSIVGGPPLAQALEHLLQRRLLITPLQSHVRERAVGLGTHDELADRFTAPNGVLRVGAGGFEVPEIGLDGGDGREDPDRHPGFSDPLSEGEGLLSDAECFLQPTHPRQGVGLPEASPRHPILGYDPPADLAVLDRGFEAILPAPKTP